MNAPRLSQAVETVAILQQAARQGLPVLIPGALETRVGRPAVRAPSATVEPGRHLEAVTTAADGRGHLERQREGGGAPGERTGRPSTTALGRLWRRLFRGQPFR